MEGEKTMRTRIYAAATGAFICLLAVSGGPVAAKTIKMTAVGAPPHFVTPVKVAKDYIIPEIDRRIAATGKDFKIEWTQAYAQTLAKFTEVFEAVEEGIADFGVLLTNFEPSKLPLEQYGRAVPFGTDDMRLMVKMDHVVRAKVPAMNKTFLKHNQVRLAGAGSQTTDMFTNFPIRTASDLKGHRIGASGSMGNYLKGTGAVIVTASMAASYTDIKNGLYDGYPIAIGLAFPYKTYEAAKYFTGVNFGSAITANLSVNLDTWQKLPRWVQQIFRQVTSEYGERYATMDANRRNKFIGIMKKKGVKFHTLSPAERKGWAMAMPNIAKEWADALEKRGVPGQAVLEAYMGELRANNVPIVRDWLKN